MSERAFVGNDKLSSEKLLYYQGSHQAVNQHLCFLLLLRLRIVYSSLSARIGVLGRLYAVFQATCVSTCYGRWGGAQQQRGTA